ncbi:MAG: hypothetical protein KDA52_05535, partial [Planctomycetaceae bacterium]|nr:hypothetical protein [Planctomycetaceae bacterium]
MADDNWYQDSDEANRSFREDPSYGSDEGFGQPKSGMSTGVKVLIGCGVVGGLMALVCCGGFVYLGSQFAGMMTEDPAEIRAIQEDIADIDLPDGFSPKGGANGELFGFSGKAAIFAENESMFMLIQVKGPDGTTDEQMLEQFQQQLGQQGQNQNIKIESTEDRSVTIAGQETTIEIVKGTDQNGKEIRQVKGAFQGRGGAALVLYFCPEADWDEERAIGIFE